MLPPFSPTGANATTTTIAATPTAAVAIPGTAVGNVVMATNTGASVAFIRFGGSTVTSDATDTTLPPNSMLPFSIDPAKMTHFSVFSATASMVIYVQRGGGT